MRPSRGLLALALCLAVPPAAAAGGLSVLETENQRQVYFPVTQDYLVPHVGRCLETSLAFQCRLFGYRPDELVTLFLKDFSDAGNASAGSVPRNHVTVDIAPLSFAYETMAPGERMYTI